MDMGDWGNKMAGFTKTMVCVLLCMATGWAIAQDTSADTVQTTPLELVPPSKELLDSWLLTGLVAEKPTLPVWQQLSQGQQQQLVDGEVLVEILRHGSRNYARMYGLIDAPPEAVWTILNDHKTAPVWNPDLKSMELLSASYEGQNLARHVRGVNDMPWPMRDRHWELDTLNEAFEYADRRYYRSLWKYIQGSGNIVDTQGYWLLEPYGINGQKTLIAYALEADLGLKLPGFLVSWATKRVLPNCIVGLRERYQSLQTQGVIAVDHAAALQLARLAH